MQDHEKRPIVVIVGAGFGGITAAQALAGKAVDTLLIDRTNHHVFQPLLYQTATAALAPSDIASPIRDICGVERDTTVSWAKSPASIQHGAWCSVREHGRIRLRLPDPGDRRRL